MIVGHYATALVPHARDPKTPLSLYLFAAIATDFLWLALAWAGPERPVPDTLLDASFGGLRVDMPFSHDLVPTLLWAVIGGGIGLAVTRRATPALWCAALVIAHELSDLLSGFGHHVWGHGTPAVGLNLYGRAPELAIVIEAAFGAAFVAAYLRMRRNQGRPVGVRTARLLYLAFTVGALIWLPIASRPLAAWFS